MRSFGRKRSSQGLHVVAEELDRGERQLAERIGNYDYDKMPPQNRNHHHHLAAGSDPEMSSSLGNETAGFSARGSKKPTKPKPPPSLPAEHAEERKYPLQVTATASAHQMPLASSETISIQKIASTSSSKKPLSKFDGGLDERKKDSPALSNKLEYAQMLSKSQVIGEFEPQSPATVPPHRRNGEAAMTEERSEDVTVENFQHGVTMGSLESKLSIRAGGGPHHPPISPRKQLNQPSQQLAPPSASTTALAKKH